MSLTTSGEEQAARQAHADYFLLLAEEAEPALKGPLLVEWLERLEQEHDNLRAALHWAVEGGRAEMALRIGVALERFWVVRGHRNEATGIPGASTGGRHRNCDRPAGKGPACRSATRLHPEPL